LRFGGVVLLGDRAQEASGHGLASLSPELDGNSIFEPSSLSVQPTVPLGSRSDNYVGF